jgi:hypothetical protein
VGGIKEVAQEVGGHGVEGIIGPAREPVGIRDGIVIRLYLGCYLKAPRRWRRKWEATAWRALLGQGVNLWGRDSFRLT